MASYDYVVLGAGSAGCVVAARLSEDSDVTVGVIEAGSRQLPQPVAHDIEVPSHWALVQHTAVDREYESVPQPHCNGRRIPEPRGRLPGGTSNLYALMHIRGHYTDYDNWAYNGCPGWSYAEVLPYFQKSENQTNDSNPTGGKGGPLNVESAALHGPNPTSAAFIEACLELGFPRSPDFNGPHMIGAGWHHVNIKDGKRHSMQEAYLYPALSRSNLELIDGAPATRLLFQGKRCTGVEVRRNGTLERIEATREVIVCAGAIDSPKMLLLSGIGDGDRLMAMGIPVLHHLPGVGENFHNHVLLPVVGVSPKPIPRPNQNMSEAALFYKSEPGMPGPDMQMGFVHGDPTQVSSDSPPPVMVMLPGLVRPLSRGWVRLASPDPDDHPLINPNYLAVEADFRRLTDAVRLSRRIYRTNAMSEWMQVEAAPGPDMPDEALGEYVRQAADSYHHQAGSCRMGLDALAVVDPQLRVHGIEGLRIADASVMPAVPSGNCHSGIVMIGEKLADMVKAARQGTVAAPAVAQTRPAVAIHHISLTCRDQAVTERWYTEHFGFRRSRVVQLGPDNRIVFLQGPGVHLELFQATEDAPIDPPTGDGYPWPSVRNFSFTVDHVDEKLAALGDAVEVAFGPMSFDDFVPGWRSAWLRDPDGNLVQITHGYVDEANPPEPPAA